MDLFTGLHERNRRQLDPAGELCSLCQVVIGFSRLQQAVGASTGHPGIPKARQAPAAAVFGDSLFLHSGIGQTGYFGWTLSTICCADSFGDNLADAWRLGMMTQCTRGQTVRFVVSDLNTWN